MADSKITALAEETTPAFADKLPIVDSAGPTSKFIQILNLFKLPAGTSTQAPLQFTPGTLNTTPAQGVQEMDSNCFYGTTDAGNRGYFPVRHVIRADTARTLTSNTTQQALFNVPTNGTLTLEVGTYIFKCFVYMTAMSATSGNGKFSLIGAGTAATGSVIWHAVGADVVADSLVAMNGLVEITATQVAANIHTATTATTMVTNIDGTFEVTTAGTLIPSFAQTTASAAIVAAGSYFYCERIGSTSMTSVGQWT